METVILCNGTYAKTPYCIETENVRLFSVEELCHYLYKNAFLLQETFFSPALFEWLQKECSLPEWARQLSLLQKDNAPILQYLLFLFEATGFYGENEIENVKKVLQSSSHLSIYEKKKLRADAYFKRGRIALAISEYEDLLKETEYADEKFRARLFHNKGVCYAFLFQYKNAAEEFKLAYRTYPNTESYVQFLSAMKLSCSKEEYLFYLSDHRESYEDSLEVERRMKRAAEQWEEKNMENRLSQMAQDKDATYYETIIQLTGQAKKDYLEMIQM